jgi:hypothetical protein
LFSSVELHSGYRLPRHRAGCGQEHSGGSVGADPGYTDDDFGPLLDGLGTGATVEVGVGEAGVTGVDADAGSDLANWTVIALTVVLDAG